MSYWFKRLSNCKYYPQSFARPEEFHHFEGTAFPCVRIQPPEVAEYDRYIFFIEDTDPDD